MNISDQTLDQLIGNAKTEEDIFGKDGLVKNLAKRIMERILASEMEHH
jgi:putative transposase